MTHYKDMYYQLLPVHEATVKQYNVLLENRIHELENENLLLKERIKDLEGKGN